jgi:hypothetical protein
MRRIAQPAPAPTHAARRSRSPKPARALELQRTIGNRRTTRLIQRVVHPLDVASELVGRKFKLTKAFGALAAGDVVTIEAWTNGSPTARVKPAAGAAVDVPKKLLRHAEAAVAGITQYDAGLDQVVRDYERGEKKLADERAKSGPDVAELEQLQKNRQQLLDQRLIQETMFNRFDPSIKKWVDHYNAKFGFTGAKALDPEIVKSMLYKETQMGTEGQHLDVPASNAIRTRFNIGQGPIDSGAITMVHILREEAPALFASYKLEGIEKAMSDAQDELVRLKNLRAPDATQRARIAELVVLSGPGDENWETFLWNFKGPGAAKNLLGVATEFLEAPAATPRKFDYDFWIQAMVRLLFLKRTHARDWTDAVRRFNGRGKDAADYRDNVMGRLKKVKAAAKAGKPFAADNI